MAKAASSVTASASSSLAVAWAPAASSQQQRGLFGGLLVEGDAHALQQPLGGLERIGIAQHLGQLVLDFLARQEALAPARAHQGFQRFPAPPCLGFGRRRQIKPVLAHQGALARFRHLHAQRRAV